MKGGKERGAYRDRDLAIERTTVKREFVNDFVSKRLALLFAAPTPTASYSYFLGHTHSSGEWRSTG